MELVDKIIQLFKLRDECKLPEGYVVTEHLLESLVNAGIHQNDVATLFESTDSNHGSKYRFESRCGGCTKKVYGPLSKTSVAKIVLSIRRDGSFTQFCDACTAKHKQQLKEERKIRDELNRQESEVRKTERFESLKSTVFNPDSSWTIPQKDWFGKICDYIEDNEVSAKIISSLDYQSFLRTPYWKAVAYRVKQLAGFKCKICTSNQKLSAHHRSYDLHGYEHTRDGLRELICVCDACHKTHHFGGHT